MTSNVNLPLISIITVVYNGESVIEKTIQSVLNQTYHQIEYLIIDGNSTDATLKIIEKYSSRIKLISEKDNGIYDAMNKGLSLASGKYVNFLNAGDSFIDQDVLLKVFDNPNALNFDFIYGDSINVIHVTKRYINAQRISLQTLRRGMGVCHQAIFANRDVTPAYDTRYKLNADYNWIIELFNGISQNRILYVAIPIVYYELGGMSEKRIYQNLKEFILITYRRFGIFQILLNLLIYTKVFLRLFKYTFFGYGK
jgi:glycosyltransferase involved in cell wall biosynthesis